MPRTGLAFLAGLALAIPLSASAQNWRTITSMRQVGREDVLRVDIEYGAGQLDIGAARPGVLYRSMMRYDADVIHPEMSFRNGRLRIGLENVRVRGRNLKSGRLDLDLSREVPIDLDLEFGAARANLDLTGLPIRELHIATGASETDLHISEPNREICENVDLNAGAAAFRAFGLGNLNSEQIQFSGGVGEVTLDFTGDAGQNMDVDIEMGFGTLTLRVPRGAGVRFKKSGILVGFDSQELVKRGDFFYSEDWDSADRRITFDVQAALGSIRMVWVDAASGEIR